MKHKSFKHAFFIAALSVFLAQWGCGSSDLTATIRGTVRYEDRQYNAGGFTGTLLQKAVRYARVEVVDSQTGSVLGEGKTDANGAYSISFPFGRSHVYARVISEAAPPGASTIMVKDLNGWFYAVGSADVSVSSGSQATSNITIADSQPGSPAGAFNILDVMTIGAEFVHGLSGVYPPALTAYWEVGSGGTYYCTGYDALYCPHGEGIYVLGGDFYGNGDTDQFDDDVLWHEFGHFIASKYSRDDSPGGYHRLSDNDLDLRLSWSEGWGDFMPGAMKTWLSSTNPGLISSATGTLSDYVDTLGSGVRIYFDFGIPGIQPSDVNSPSYMYASNEAAVAKILLNLMAGSGNFGMQSVWNVIRSFTPTNPSTPVSLESFWDEWHAQRSATFTSEKAALEAIYGDRQIFYKEDPFEADNDDSPILVSRASFTINGPGETHYLYKNDGSADVDIIPFDVVSGLTYTIRTASLRNGTDTYLRILAPDQTTEIAANDNMSNGTYTPPFNPDGFGIYHENGCGLLGCDLLGSSITFTPTFTDTYYVEITSSSSRPASAGRYGTYTLTITSP